MVVLDFMERDAMQRSPHPPYSSDLAQSDFSLFDHVEQLLRGSEFADREALLHAIGDIFGAMMTPGSSTGNLKGSKSPYPPVFSLNFQAFLSFSFADGRIFLRVLSPTRACWSMFPRQLRCFLSDFVENVGHRAF
jgi:hypothetical protein